MPHGKYAKRHSRFPSGPCTCCRRQLLSQTHQATAAPAKSNADGTKSRSIKQPSTASVQALFAVGFAQPTLHTTSSFFRPTLVRVDDLFFVCLLLAGRDSGLLPPITFSLCALSILHGSFGTFYRHFHQYLLVRHFAQTRLYPSELVPTGLGQRRRFEAAK
jgi:hypothetical protein